MELVDPRPDRRRTRDRRVRELAVESFVATECEGMARIDFFVTPDGEVVVNEINTIPGFTSTSVYAKLFEASGFRTGTCSTAWSSSRSSATSAAPPGVLEPLHEPLRLRAVPVEPELREPPVRTCQKLVVAARVPSARRRTVPRPFPAGPAPGSRSIVMARARRVHRSAPRIDRRPLVSFTGEGAARRSKLPSAALVAASTSGPARAEGDRGRCGRTACRVFASTAATTLCPLRQDRVPVSCGVEQLDDARHPSAAGSLDLVRHRLVEALETDADSLGILAACERGRADEVCEDDRDELSFLPRGTREVFPRRTVRAMRARRRATLPRRRGPRRARRRRSSAGRAPGCSSRGLPL